MQHFEIMVYKWYRTSPISQFYLLILDTNLKKTCKAFIGKKPRYSYGSKLYTRVHNKRIGTVIKTCLLHDVYIFTTIVNRSSPLQNYFNIIMPCLLKSREATDKYICSII